jgi:hypothetical protein
VRNGYSATQACGIAGTVRILDCASNSFEQAKFTTIRRIKIACNFQSSLTKGLKPIVLALS